MKRSQGSFWSNSVFFLCAVCLSAVFLAMGVEVSTANADATEHANLRNVFSYGANTNGQLGIGQTTPSSSTTRQALANEFSTFEVSSLSTGFAHTCAIVSSPPNSAGSYCWGLNEDHQIGTGRTGEGSFVNQLSPHKLTLESGNVVANFTQIKACKYHSIALDQAGQVYTWGGYRYHAKGFLGFDPTEEKPRPTRVTAIPGDMIGVSCGDMFSVAWTKNVMYTWGDNTEGQLGVNGTISVLKTPNSITLGDTSGIKQVVTGAKHICVLMESGSVWCWGSAQYGQIGVDVSPATFAIEPTRVQNVPAPSTSVIQLSSMTNTVFALLSDDRVLAWGDNSKGQLGYDGGSSPAPQITPIEVLETRKDIESFYASAFSNSIFLRTKQGDYYAWGDNEYGNLALGHLTTPVTAPTKTLELGSEYLEPTAHPGSGFTMIRVKPVCFGRNNNPPNDPPVCGGQGYCASHDKCTCESGYGGDDCSKFSCHGLIQTDPLACAGHGLCTGPNTCTCTEGQYYGVNCTLPICFGVQSDFYSVCGGSSHGKCIAPDTCKCRNGYSGENCEVFSCFGTLNTDQRVCSGRGTCSSMDSCQCKGTRYRGKKCEVDGSKRMVGIVVGSILGFFALVIVVVVLATISGYIGRFRRARRMAMQAEMQRGMCS